MTKLTYVVNWSLRDRRGFEVDRGSHQLYRSNSDICFSFGEFAGIIFPVIRSKTDICVSVLISDFRVFCYDRWGYELIVDNFYLVCQLLKNGEVISNFKVYGNG